MYLGQTKSPQTQHPQTSEHRLMQFSWERCANNKIFGVRNNAPCQSWFFFEKQCTNNWLLEPSETRVVVIVPRGSKYPLFQDSGSKCHTLNGFWDQSPYMLGTWTLWVFYDHTITLIFVASVFPLQPWSYVRSRCIVGAGNNPRGCKSHQIPKYRVEIN